MALVGFLKFLKREKKSELEELDLPPAPPPLEGFEGEAPELPEVPEWPGFEEKISAQEELPKFELPEKEEMPEFPSLAIGEEPEIAPPVIAPRPLPPRQLPEIEEEAMQQEIDEEPKEGIHPKIEKRFFVHEKGSFGEKPKTIYLRVDKFREAIGGLNIIRNDLRKSEEELVKLEKIKNLKDKSFDKVKLSIDDLQKKLIFIDKTLFKEGRK